MPNAIGRAADVGKPDDNRLVVDWGTTEWGGVDVLVSNAGISAGSVLETSHEDWHEAIHTNLVGSMHHAALTAPLVSDGGLILFVGAISADERGAGGNVYVAGKSGLQGFSEAFGKALAPKGVRVINLEPGMVISDMTAENTEAPTADEAAHKILDAKDIGRVAVFLAGQPARVQVPNLVVQPLVSDE